MAHNAIDSTLARSPTAPLRSRAPAASSGHAMAGFGLLEAIVSLALISVGAMAAYDWINTNLISVGRIQDVARKTEAKNNILGYLDNLNPMQQGSGQQAFLHYRIRWQSKPVAPPRDQVNSASGTGLYQVALYRVSVAVSRPQQGHWFSMSWTQIGYKQVRKARGPLS
ncbi:type II secretion system protein [Salinisphaera sp. RV14]|uniref:type II secretion system protein n=1 Tax=unclassified Salinisphaera TaxID=2649847 RepID=UPI003F86F88D